MYKDDYPNRVNIIIQSYKNKNNSYVENVGIFLVVMKFCNYAYKLSNLF